MNYKKAYFKHYKLDECDILYCVVCGQVATNLHHIKYRGQGGTDKPENLAPLCYYCHSAHHEKNNPTTEEIKQAMLLYHLPF